MTTPAWTTPKTWSAGDVLSATDLNTYVRDNSNFAYGSRSCQLKMQHTPSISQGVWTAVNWTPSSTGASPEQWDNGGFFDKASSISRITIPASCTGLYSIQLNMVFASDTTGLTRGVGVKKNGAVSYYLHTHGTANDGTYNGYISAATTLSLTAGDYVEAIVYHNKAGTLNLSDGYLTITYVGQPT